MVGVAERADSKLSNQGLQSPTQKPLLSLQEGQGKKINQMKEQGNSDWFMWVFAKWCFIWLGFFPQKQYTEDGLLTHQCINIFHHTKPWHRCFAKLSDGKSEICTV